MTASIDAHVRLDTHPTHPSAVQAVLTGTQARVASTALEAAGWSAAATGVMALARIDHEEPYWAADAAQHLTAEGITVEITPRLQEAIDENGPGRTTQCPGAPAAKSARSPTRRRRSTTTSATATS
ncbi:hypothetical protein [Streptomyces tendae]